ncbi:MAG: formylmethanofuran dehydrogenase subunit E family protein [Proteobacteria bacterium]|nr:formylmethanofuran dehydrogenase subunit E family protein [Pseudomonadota bacterium]MBU1586143.1 formylmethanofuran dehydrogenase subunit E family protein [Pseudomonadota bacterium]MBU2627619.1 formylmethanofuran dehydrogenase subunit E family protein [Pseudomonadota bacterium]
MMDFETLLKGSAQEHGHLCPGQVVGVRMALLGLDLIGLENPKETRDIKKIIVYVEIDRCATDAISYVTGVKLGRRSLKFKDYGIMAATFVNLETHKAFRIVSTESSRKTAALYAPHVEDPHDQQLEAYKIMPLCELFEVKQVTVHISASDMPGPADYKTCCNSCGVIIRDKKEVLCDEKALCHACAGKTYYKEVMPVRI